MKDKKKTDSIAKTVRLPKSLWEEIQKKANKECRSAQNYIRFQMEKIMANEAK